MATNLLTTGATIDEEGAEFTVAPGVPCGVNLKDFSNTARVAFVKKDDGNALQESDAELTAAKPGGTIVSPGTYKPVRKRGTCGVFRD